MLSPSQIHTVAQHNNNRVRAINMHAGRSINIACATNDAMLLKTMGRYKSGTVATEKVHERKQRH